MNDVDVILGYPWMESIGTININVEKKFMKLWYKKKKITLQDKSLSTREGPKKVSTGNIIAVPIETSMKRKRLNQKKKLQKDMKKSPKKCIKRKKNPRR
jgi:hypothetical protein